MKVPGTPLRVHIAYTGHDTDRVTEPLIRLQADVAYLFHGGPDPRAKECHAQNLEKLQSHPSIRVEAPECDPWTLSDVLTAYAKVIHQNLEQGHHVFVNVSTGSKLAAMGGVISCMLWGARPYYAQLGGPASVTGDGRTIQAVVDIIWPPVLRLPTLDAAERTILKLLAEAEEPPRKEELVKALTAKKVIKSDSKSPAAKYNQLERLLSRPSLAPFVEVDGKYRRARVRLTPEGRDAIELLVRPLLSIQGLEKSK